MHIHTQVSSHLLELEQALRDIGLWETTSPNPAALASTQPFCVDTLTFPQWIQFIFIPRMHSLCEQHQPLPTACGIAPMSEEYFRAIKIDGSTITRELIAIDQALNQHQ